MLQPIIILLGPPGSGKGTQATLLSEKRRLYYFETSKILETAFAAASQKRYIVAEGKKYDVLQEKKIWEKGILCSPPFVTQLVKEKVKALAARKKGIIFSGSPRTLYEAKKLTPFLKKLYGAHSIKVIALQLSPKETIFRNSHRRICELMRHPILYTKETAKLQHCPLDGSKLVRRKGLDDPETITTRLKEYKERTLPILDYLKMQKVYVKEVNGEQSVAEVFSDIIKALK